MVVAKTFKDSKGKTGKIGSKVVSHYLTMNSEVFDLEKLKAERPEAIFTVNAIYRAGAAGTQVEVEGHHGSTAGSNYTIVE